MVGQRASLEYLSSVPLFSGLSKRDLRRVAEAAEEITVEEGETLVDQGRPGDELFVVLKGKAVVRRNNRKVGDLGPGEYFGELALLDRLPRAASVIASTPMTLLVLGRRRFGDVLEEVPGMATTLLASMAGRLRDAHTKAVQL